jgi:hypothetical protein
MQGGAFPSPHRGFFVRFKVRAVGYLAFWFGLVIVGVAR